MVCGECRRSYVKNPATKMYELGCTGRYNLWGGGAVKASLYRVGVGRIGWCRAGGEAIYLLGLSRSWLCIQAVHLSAAIPSRPLLPLSTPAILLPPIIMI